MPTKALFPVPQNEAQPEPIGKAVARACGNDRSYLRPLLTVQFSSRNLRGVLQPLRFGVPLAAAVCLGLPAAAQAPVQAPAGTENPPANREVLPRTELERAPLDRNHHLGPGDVLDISVNGLQPLSKVVKLFTDGTFDYPLLGTVNAAGLTTGELGDKMTAGLKETLRRPVVTILIKERYFPPVKEEKIKIPKIVALGAVTKKGLVDLLEPRPLRTVLAELGPTERADLAKIRIRYPDGSARTVDFSQFNRTGEAKDDLTIKGGEEIIVLEKPEKPVKETQYVRIAGAVGTPNLYELKPNFTLQDLILAGGKLSLLADVEHVELRRKGHPPQTINLMEQAQKGLDGMLRLEPDDEIYIPQRKDTVTVIGAFSNAGPRPVKPGETLREFVVTGNPDLAAAVNPAQMDLKKVEVIRRGQEPLTVNLQEVLKRPKHKNNVTLQTGDVIFIPPQGVAKRNPLDYVNYLGPLSILFTLF